MVARLALRGASGRSATRPTNLGHDTEIFNAKPPRRKDWEISIAEPPFIIDARGGSL